MTRIKDLVAGLRRDGWYLDRQAGSHRQFRHPIKTNTLTIAFADGAQIPDWLAARIRREAGLIR